jgi:prephenate dehydrogenase
LKASRQEGIYLWGAGRYGRLLAEYLEQRNVKIYGIVDNNISSLEMSKFQVVSFDQVKDGAKIFIAIEDKVANEEIARKITSIHKKTIVVRFQDLFI